MPEMNAEIIGLSRISGSFPKVIEDELGADVLVVQAGAALARFLDKGGAFVNVKALGAKGDGISDDTAAILAAVALAGPGGIIYFPLGVYKCGTITMLEYQTFFGASRFGTVLKDRDGGKTDFIVLHDHCLVTNLGLTGTFQTNAGPNYSTHFAFVARGKTGAKIIGCRVTRHFWWNAMFIQGSTDCHMVGCDLEGTVNSHCVEINGSSHCSVDSCRIKNGDNGVELWARTETDEVGNRVVNCLIEACSGGVAVYGGHDALVQENVILDSLGVGILVDRVQETLPQPQPAMGTKVRGNVVKRSGSVGVFIKESEDSDIEGNTISGSGAQGMYVQYGRHIIRGNVIKESWITGLYATSNTSYCVISDNRCVNNSMAGIQQGNGMEVQGAHHSITGNLCTDTRPVKRQGTGLFVQHGPHVISSNVLTGNIGPGLNDTSVGSQLSANLT